MRLTTLHVLAAAAGLLAGRTATVCLAQTGPVNGMRPAPLRTHAIVGADVVVAPGKTIEKASILIRDGGQVNSIS